MRSVITSVGLALTFVLAAAPATAAEPPTTPRDFKPVLVTPPATSTVESPQSVTQETMLRDALTMVCRNSIERSALGNNGYRRGKSVVPEDAARYVQQMREYQSFACPCLVNTLEKRFDFTDVSSEALDRIKPVMGQAMQTTCSRDAYVAQLTPASSRPTP